MSNNCQCIGDFQYQYSTGDFLFRNERHRSVGVLVVGCCVVLIMCHKKNMKVNIIRPPISSGDTRAGGEV